MTRGGKAGGVGKADQATHERSQSPLSPPIGGCPSPKKKGEVTLAKEAVETLAKCIDMHRAGEELSGYRVSNADVPVAALELVLRHYAKLTRKKVSSKGRYVKGRAFEYEVRDYLVSRGLKCRRVTQSGGGVEKDDLVLTTGFGAEYRLECKRVAKLPAYLINETEATIFRVDNGQSLVLTSLERFADHCQ
jgi:hypothetical protein